MYRNQIRHWVRIIILFCFQFLFFAFWIFAQFEVENIKSEKPYEIKEGKETLFVIQPCGQIAKDASCVFNRWIYTHIAQSDIERYKNDLWDFYNKKGATANSPISLEYFIDFSRIEQLQNSTRNCSFSAIYSIIDFDLCY